MHNGMVGGFGKLRKRIEQSIPDALYDHRRGATDSETLFLLALGLGLERRPRQAMADAVRRVEGLSRELGAKPHMRFTGCWTDGRTLYAARYASDDRAPTLFHRRTGRGTLVVSEPLDDAREGWTALGPNSLLVASDQGVTIETFMFHEMAGHD